jgi:hypothetical protein
VPQTATAGTELSSKLQENPKGGTREQGKMKYNSVLSFPQPVYKELKNKKKYCLKNS